LSPGGGGRKRGEGGTLWGGVSHHGGDKLMRKVENSRNTKEGDDGKKKKSPKERRAGGGKKLGEKKTWKERPSLYVNFGCQNNEEVGTFKENIDEDGWFEGWGKSKRSEEPRIGGGLNVTVRRAEKREKREKKKQPRCGNRKGLKENGPF